MITNYFPSSLHNFFFFFFFYCPVGKAYNILPPKQGGDSHPSCPGYNTKLHLMVRFQVWGVWSHTFIAIIPSPTLTRVVIPVRVPSMGEIDLLKIFCILLEYLMPDNCKLFA